MDILLNEGVRRYLIERLDESSEIIQKTSSFFLALLTAQDLFRRLKNPPQEMKLSKKILGQLMKK